MAKHTCTLSFCKADLFEWDHNYWHQPDEYTWAEWAAKRASARLWSWIKPYPESIPHLWWLTAPEPDLQTDGKQWQ